MAQLAKLQFRFDRPSLFLATMALWAAVGLSLQTEISSIPGILHPNSLWHFTEGIRAVLPLAAALVSLGVIIYRFRLARQDARIFVSPLGLATVYGLTGIIAAALSADVLLSLYWAALYISVPLVLLALSWRSDAVEISRFVVNLNWLGVILATSAFFFYAIIKMDLADSIINPGGWARCEYIGSWFADSGGKLRSTGVGRFAAIAAILALGGLWNPRLRYVWAVFLFFSVFLMFSTNARTAIIGFGGAASLMIFLYGGKKAALYTTIISGILVPVFWITDAHNDFIDHCILRSGFISGSSLLVTGPPNQNDKEPISASIPTRSAIPSEPTVQPSPTLEGLTIASPSRPSEQTAKPPIVSTTSEIPPAPTDRLPIAPTTPEIPLTPLSGVKTEQTSSPPVSERLQASPTPIAPTGSPSPTPRVAIVAVTQPTESPQPTPTLADNPPEPSKEPTPETGRIPSGFFTFSGRTVVWEASWDKIKTSPFLGYGFHADRIMLGTHLHNTYLHSMLQAGILGSIPLYVGLISGIVLFVRAARHLNEFSQENKQLIIQCGGVLMFFAIRSITESSGAFFGVDWLILAPLLLFLRAITDLPNRATDS